MTNVWGERLAASACIAAAVGLGIPARDFPAGGGHFPLFLSACMILVGASMLAATMAMPWRYQRRLRVDLSWDACKSMAVLALAVVYVIAAFRLGYYVSTLIFLLVAPFVAGLKRPMVVVGATAASLCFIYGLFHVALQAQVPAGLLF